MPLRNSLVSHVLRSTCEGLRNYAQTGPRDIHQKTLFAKCTRKCFRSDVCPGRAAFLWRVQLYVWDSRFFCSLLVIPCNDFWILVGYSALWLLKQVRVPTKCMIQWFDRNFLCHSHFWKSQSSDFFWEKLKNRKTCVRLNKEFVHSWVIKEWFFRLYLEIW